MATLEAREKLLSFRERGQRIEIEDEMKYTQWLLNKGLVQEAITVIKKLAAGL